MEFRRLRYFVSVAEELHYTRAASRLRVAQPHLSQEIRKLEQEIGVELFARTKRSVALTPAGRVFLERVRDIFEATDEAVKETRRASRGEAGRLAIGFVSVAAYSAIPNAIATFRRSHPDVELAVSELNSDEGVEEVRSGRLDVCLVHPPRNLDPQLSAETAWGEPLVLALPREHKLVGTRRISLRKLESDPWVLWRREIASRLYDEIIAACVSAGFEPKVAQLTVRMATVVSLVASGIGVALVPATAAQMGIQGVVFRPLLGALISVPVSFVWRRGEAAPALAPFMAAVRQTKLKTPSLQR